jgi:arginyl-tRNA synthetase
MHTLLKAKQQILQDIKRAVGGGFVPVLAELSEPPDAKMGDVAFACFTLAKKVKKNPAELAIEIAAKIGGHGYVSSVRALGPYVNFSFNYETFGKDVLKDVAHLGEAYGTSDIGKGKRVMIEYANLNTHKDVHIGHLRNLFVGQTAVNLFRANGYEVIPTAYINDLGAHVAKSVWAIMNLHKDEDVAKDKRISFLRDVYVEATRYVEDHPNAKEQISEAFRHLEDQKGEEVAVWKETRKWSLDYLKKVYKELHIGIEEWYFESDLIKKTKKEIDKLVQKGIVTQSEGAWIVDLRDQNLGVNLLVKTDGTLLYNAKDLGLALKKEEDYHSLRSIYVVDNRQSHAMQQLFATLKLMGFEKELTHLSYDFVTLKDGAMSSRKGNDIRYEELRDKMIAHAAEETKKRHEDWKQKDVEKTASAIAFAAMRFSMLKQDIEKPIVFELEESLVFEGFTGPYVLYTLARIESLLKKAPKRTVTQIGDELKTSVEHELISQIAKYPDVIFDCVQTLQLSHVAQYLFDLSQTFAAFYSEVPILKADLEVMNARLALAESVACVLKNGLDLMGIEPVEQM